MLKQLQQKFVLLTTTISVIVMLLIAIALNITNYVSIMHNSDEVLELLMEGSLKMGQPFSNHERFPREMAFTTRYFVIKSNASGEFDFIDTKNISSVTTEEAVEYASFVNEDGSFTGTVDNFRYIKAENQLGYTYLFLDIEDDLISFESYLYFSVFVLISAIITIFLLSVLLSKKAVKPIADSYERQKGFITNVSHEFKTPLTIIKADCDVIEIDSGESEWTESIKTQITRLDTLVENLVSLTKLDEKVQIIKSEFSLSDAITDTVNEFSASMKSNELNLVLDVVENISYSGDEALIRNIISILTENSIKYSLPKGDLKISLNSVGNKKIFSIENNCEEIEVGKHNDWFQRFYRGDKSRNSKTKGYGIGLSIAKTICDLHSAKISAESKTGKEIQITVIF